MSDKELLMMVQEFKGVRYVDNVHKGVGKVKYHIIVKEHYTIEEEKFIDTKIDMIVVSRYVAYKLYDLIKEWVKSNFYHNNSIFTIKLSYSASHQVIKHDIFTAKLTDKEYCDTINKFLLDLKEKEEKELEYENQ